MNQEQPKLPRVLNFRDLYLLIVGSVIGSGIFLVPASVLQETNRSFLLALFVWLGGGTLSLLGALTYGELSARNPQAGGLYIYIRDAFGRLPAFLYGWSLFLVIGSAAIATLAVAFSAYLSEILPLNPWERKMVSVFMIAVVAFVNVRGTRQSANLQNWTTGAKIAAILIMSAFLLLLGVGLSSADFRLPSSFGWSMWRGVGLAMIGVLWAYEGWQFATFNAAEVLDPQRTYPRAFLFGLISLMTLYILANFGYVAALNAERASNSESIAATALSAVAGQSAGKIVAAAILTSIFSAANSIILTSSRVFYAMAADGLFFSSLARVHPRFRTPVFSIISASIWASVLALSGTFEQLLTYVVFTGWIFYALSAASLFVYRKRKVGESTPYRVPGYPWTPCMFIAAGFLLATNTLVERSREGLIGLLMVCSGIPAHLLWRRRSARLS
jgi:basic amino acid/polyamine antiporter, APA family